MRDYNISIVSMGYPYNHGSSAGSPEKAIMQIYIYTLESVSLDSVSTRQNVFIPFLVLRAAFYFLAKFSELTKENFKMALKMCFFSFLVAIFLWFLKNLQISLLGFSTCSQKCEGILNFNFHSMFKAKI
jgi:hypothetical protein